MYDGLQILQVWIYYLMGGNVSPYRSTVIKAILNDVVRTQ